MKTYTKLVIVFLIIFVTPVAMAQESVSPKHWTLEQCLEYGLSAHPQLKIAESNVAGEKARLLQIDSAYDPKVNMRASWNHSKVDAARNRNLADPTTDSTSESVGASKLLYDSGQTSLQKKAARESLTAANSRLAATLTEVAANIKSAFFKAQQARALLQVRLETLEGYERHLEKVKGFVEVGTRAPYDITRAQVDVANARVDLITARSQLKVALANLTRNIGLNEAISIAAYDQMHLPVSQTADKEQLITEAMGRPEVRASQSQVRAADYKVKEARQSQKPSLSASADYQWSGTSAPLDRQWGMGVSMSWPVFDGSITRAKIDSAKSSFDNTAASLENLKLSVSAELENSITGLTDALERFQATKVLVQQASESMLLAEGRYDAGLGSPLEITDASVEFAKARGNHIVSYFDSLIAQVELDRVLGRFPAEYRIKEIVPESEKSGDKVK